MNILKIMIAALVLLLSANAVLADAKLAKREMSVEGEKRSYYIRYPQTLDSQSRFPLVIVLHGGGKRDGDETAEMTGFAKMTDREKFIAVFPNGIKSKWHDGRLPKRKQETYLENSENDITFIKDLVAYMVKYEQVDASRVYLTGISNGGMMTMRMACEASELFAAVAPVIAGMPVEIVESCKPKAPVSFLLMNGTEDPMVPWQGGEVHAFFKDRGKVLSGEETFNFWREKNACLKKADTDETLANKNTDDKSVITRKTYSCPNNINMEFHVVRGGGHTMPGSDIPNRKRILGQKNLDADGAELIWNFFAKQQQVQQ